MPLPGWLRLPARQDRALPVDDWSLRSVYARILDNWLGTSSVSLLGGDFRKSSLNFI